MQTTYELSLLTENYLQFHTDSKMGTTLHAISTN